MDTLHQNPSLAVSFRRRDGMVAQVAGAALLEVRQMVQTLFEDGALRLNRAGKPEDVLFYWPLVEQDSALGERFATVWQEPIAEETTEAFFLGLRAYLVGKDRTGYVHIPTVRHPLSGDTLVVETLMMNTVQVLGSDLLRVLTKLAFDSKNHCYVDPGDCAWLADLLERGLHTHVLKPSHGWSDVIALLYGAVTIDSSVVTDVEGAEQGRFPDDAWSLSFDMKDLFLSDPSSGSSKRQSPAPWKASIPCETRKSQVEMHQGTPSSSREEVSELEQSVRRSWLQLPFEQRWDLADKAQRRPIPALNVFQISPYLTATQSFGDGLSGCDLYSFLLEDAEPRS